MMIWNSTLTCCLLSVLVGLSCPSLAKAAKEGKFDPTDHYREQRLNGWRLLVNKRLLSERELCRKTLRLLDDQLFQITRVVPAKPLAKLRKVTIWVEKADPNHPCMCYHPDAEWLRENNMNPDKTKGVELANAENFLTWTIQQPWMVFHELAHAYHDQFLDDGFEHKEVLAAFDQAMADKLYDKVLRINAKRVKAYATTNQMEYFAEASEAFFGTNDFYPYVRSELKEHDPRLFVVLEKAWGLRH